MMNQHRASEASKKVSMCVLRVEWRSYSEHGEGGSEGGGGRRELRASVSEEGRESRREGGREPVA